MKSFCVNRPEINRNIARALPLIVVSFLLLSCGGSAEGQSGASEDASGGLENTAISMSSALAGAAAAAQRTKEGISGSCPFLSTATAIATVKTPYAFVLREASNTKCVWNYNIGFEIKVSVEPSATAKPISERLYDLDNPPLIKPQSGPGADAAIAFDTTWKERPPRPYAFGFALGSDYIFIRTTGVATSEAQLRRAADEIARKLPDAPAVVAADTTATLPAAFDVCGIWSKDTLGRVFDVQEGGNVSSYASSPTICSVSIFPTRSAGNKISLDFNFWKTPAGDYEFRKANGWTAVELGGKRALLQEKEDQFGFASQYIAPMENGSFGLTVISKDPAMKAKARLLAENALSRIGD